MIVSPYTGRAYGAVHRDTPDARDHVSTPPKPEKAGLFLSLKFPFIHKGKNPNAKVEVYDKCDLEQWCGPVKDQGQEGSCTGQAYSGMREFLYRKYFEFEKDKRVAPDKAIFSAQFVYYRERQLEGTIAQDNGAQPRSGAKVLNKFGVCLESTFPYRAGEYTKQPNVLAVIEALRYRAGAYHRIIGGVEDMKSVLKSGYVFTMAIMIYESFEDDSVARSGIVPIPDIRREKNYGGHEILVIGYDDKRQAFKVRNSWGTNWGNNGNFWLPYKFVADDNLIWDPWIQHLGPAWK